MDAGHAFLLSETAATIFMASVLWTMQVLDYPLLALVGRDAFVGYETAHNHRPPRLSVCGCVTGRLCHDPAGTAT